jgi:hypothetical protein
MSYRTSQDIAKRLAEANPDNVGGQHDLLVPKLSVLARPRSGHNGGPPLDVEDPDASRRLWCWKRAHKIGWSAPREVALRRLARAKTLGMTYREYTLEVLERGRHL